MTDQSSTGLTKLLRKVQLAADVDFLREGMRVFSEAVMELEVTQHIGAERHARTPERTGQRNGCAQRRVQRHDPMRKQPEHEQRGAMTGEVVQHKQQPQRRQDVRQRDPHRAPLLPAFPAPPVLRGAPYLHRVRQGREEPRQFRFQPWMLHRIRASAHSRDAYPPVRRVERASVASRRHGADSRVDAAPACRRVASAHRDRGASDRVPLHPRSTPGARLACTPLRSRVFATASG